MCTSACTHRACVGVLAELNPEEDDVYGMAVCNCCNLLVAGKLKGRQIGLVNLAYIVMAYTAMAYVVMAYIVMAANNLLVVGKPEGPPDAAGKSAHICCRCRLCTRVVSQCACAGSHSLQIGSRVQLGMHVQHMPCPMHVQHMSHTCLHHAPRWPKTSLSQA